MRVEIKGTILEVGSGKFTPEGGKEIEYKNALIQLADDKSVLKFKSKVDVSLENFANKGEVDITCELVAGQGKAATLRIVGVNS